MLRPRQGKNLKKWIYVAGTLAIVGVFGSLPLIIRQRRKDSVRLPPTSLNGALNLCSTERVCMHDCIFTLLAHAGKYDV